MLPIEPLLPEIRQRLSSSSSLVLEAPPGAGKTTRVPLALLDEPWLRGQRILMLEPRRLAARAAANRIDRKSTRLNSSHVRISYAVFCLKKKKIKLTIHISTQHITVVE